MFKRIHSGSLTDVTVKTTLWATAKRTPQMKSTTLSRKLKIAKDGDTDDVSPLTSLPEQLQRNRFPASLFGRYF